MPDPTLQALALRYAAGDLTPDETAAFELQLACDQQAREVLAEVIRLSAQALGQPSPKPHACFRHWTRARLSFTAYRGHPLLWSGLGAILVAAALGAAISFLEPQRDPPGIAAERWTADRSPDGLSPPREADVGPLDGLANHNPSASDDQLIAENCGDVQQLAIAELWAEWSSSATVEKAHQNLVRWRQLVRDTDTPTSSSELPRHAETTETTQP
ncbi:MAG: hypothetical protein RMJ56_09185 [Gemmataceae bacterium]|nr:hypothetical protein [Gemmata sp.]MDW8197761.1 hypothetical protein [Gemmataceae bacterium]